MTQNRYWIFLERLRRAGSTNMWGAATNLMEEFDLKEKEAVQLLSDWIGTYDSDDYIGLDESEHEKTVENQNVPIVGFQTYDKFGLIPVRTMITRCPRCNDILNAGPKYQPNYCSNCGIRLSWDTIEWVEEECLF